jgi:hypothetical protein
MRYVEKFAPSCNGSPKESQKLTGDAAGETPRTSALLERYVAMEIRTDTAFQSELTDLARQLERELSSLSRELEGVRKDAERYRFLREQAESAEGMTADGLDVGINWHRFTWKPIGPWPDAFDKAVDAAIDSALRE